MVLNNFSAVSMCRFDLPCVFINASFNNSALNMKLLQMAKWLYPAMIALLIEFCLFRLAHVVV